MPATGKDPRLISVDEIVAIARRADRDPASLSADEIRALALYVALREQVDTNS